MFKARQKSKEKIIIELIIDENKETFELCEPTFEVKAKALEALIGGADGTIHLINSGRIIFDACYTGELIEVKKDEDVYVSVCMKAAELVKLYEGELKKN